MSGTDTIEVPQAVLERLLDRVDDLEAELSQYRSENERDKATIRQDVHEAIEKAEEGEETDDAQSDESGAQDDSMTPMEQVIRAGAEGVMFDVTASVRRAKAIAEHFCQWAQKTPNGLVIKDGLKTLVETATDERLFWKQIERAGHALEKFTKGAIQFRKTRRHGWTLVAEPAFVKQLGRASSVTGG
jgi:phosphosulfolactate synthase (CoM biosynthesis protein A)